MAYELLKKIKAYDVKGALLLFGEEEYLVKFYADNLINTYVDELTKAFNLIRIRQPESLDKVADACETFPFMAERKVVLVKDSGWFKSGNNSKASENASSKSSGKDSFDSQFEEFLKNIPDFCTVVFIEKDVAKNRKTYKLMAKLGSCEEQNYLEGRMLNSWIAKQFSVRGKNITQGACEMLADFSGPSMSFLINEIDKLSALLGERGAVDENDVLNVCGKTPKARVFDITDALGVKNVKRAMEIISDLIALNEPVQMILIITCNHLKRLLELKLLTEDGMPFRDAAQMIGLAKGFVSNKYEKQMRMFTLDKLKKLSHLAQEVDIYNKTGGFDEKVALDLIVAMCA